MIARVCQNIIEPRGKKDVRRETSFAPYTYILHLVLIVTKTGDSCRLHAASLNAFNKKVSFVPPGKTIL